MDLPLIITPYTYHDLTTIPSDVWEAVFAWTNDNILHAVHNHRDIIAEYYVSDQVTSIMAMKNADVIGKIDLIIRKEDEFPLDTDFIYSACPSQAYVGTKDFMMAGQLFKKYLYDNNLATSIRGYSIGVRDGSKLQYAPECVAMRSGLNLSSKRTIVKDVGDRVVIRDVSRPQDYNVIPDQLWVAPASGDTITLK